MELVGGEVRSIRLGVIELTLGGVEFLVSLTVSEVLPTDPQLWALEEV